MVRALRLLTSNLWLLAVLFAAGHLLVEESAAQVAFPTERPKDGNFNRPVDDTSLDISPPGFCWWRAGRRDKVQYQLTILDSSEKTVYQSPVLRDPVHVPTKVLAAGDYTWTVSAIVDGDSSATLGPRSFKILEDAVPLPWIEPSELLRKIPEAHPRLLFPAAQQEELRATLSTTRKKPYAELLAIADKALELEIMAKPTFDRFDRKKEYAQRRTDYRASYHQFTRTYHKGMLPLAAVYVLSGERRYGEAAKAHLLNLVDWEVDGIASLESSFDEIGLRIQRTAAQAYDWLYDLMTPEEREKVKAMLIAHGNAMLARLEERDFLNKSAYSHDGRLPGYLIEFSIALAEEPVAQEWMDYALRTIMTVFPHWAGAEGGWAEGVNYSLSYNDRFITPLHSLNLATGHDLLQMPFFRKFPHFLMYNVAPSGEVVPFGDGEHKNISRRMDELYSILYFHSLRNQDPATRWWIDLLPRENLEPDRLGVLHRLLLPDTLTPVPPRDLPLDRAFRGVGWSVFHSELARPKDDLMVMFKSSPYGPVSHSHADQNSFVIMKGGQALAIPGGERFPQHGSPFHEQYTQQTIAHNALLIDGKGQRNRDATARGKIVDFRSSRNLAYVAGDARDCYPSPLAKYVRHVVFVRPSLLVVLDELEAETPVEISWLMHTKEKSSLNLESQSFTARRNDERMAVSLTSSAGSLTLSQTDQWPMKPKEGYPMVEAPDPPKQWHFKAVTSQRQASHRLAAVMMIGDSAKIPTHNIRPTDDGIRVFADLDKGQAEVSIRLTGETSQSQPLIQVTFEPAGGNQGIADKTKTDKTETGKTEADKTERLSIR